eukprot:1565541-Amphidinium_carterae.2
MELQGESSTTESTERGCKHNATETLPQKTAESCDKTPQACPVLLSTKAHRVGKVQVSTSTL